MIGQLMSQLTILDYTIAIFFVMLFVVYLVTDDYTFTSNRQQVILNVSVTLFLLAVCQILTFIVHIVIKYIQIHIMWVS